MRKKIEGINNLVKDTNNKAILNVDKDALVAYKKQRDIISKSFTVNEEINSLKKEVVEIKAMLLQLINNK